MRICGIDPGTARVGWAMIDFQKHKPISLAYGCITTEKTVSPELRLLSIYQNLLKILRKYQPEELGLEELFFASNAKTAISVGQARGVILLAAASLKIPVYSYTPLLVKKAICGYGQAEKIQIQKMVSRLLKLKEIPRPDDAADALAIALTHAYTLKYK